MAKALTKQKWADLKEVLLQVPIRARNVAWKNAVDLVEQVLDGRNNLVPDMDAKAETKFAVSCAICHQQIDVEDDFVRHALSSTYVHYDCHHRSTGSLGERA